MCSYQGHSPDCCSKAAIHAAPLKQPVSTSILAATAKPLSAKPLMPQQGRAQQNLDCCSTAGPSMQLQLQRLASDYAQGDRLAAFGALLLLLQLQSSPAATLLAAGRPAAAQGMSSLALHVPSLS